MRCLSVRPSVRLSVCITFVYCIKTSKHILKIYGRHTILPNVMAIFGRGPQTGTGRDLSPSRPLLAVPNVTAHPSTANVPITVLLYNGPMLCGFNQWRSQRGALGVQPPIPIEAFFHSRKVTVIKYYSLSLTTRRTINSHDLRKTNHWGGGAGVYCSPIDTILW